MAPKLGWKMGKIQGILGKSGKKKGVKLKRKLGEKRGRKF